ncbi:MAG: hypothetical protein USCGTAYLOR_00121 [Chromatiales bacterium USCg_Taylor]|nr:MAG: hypothetical protein USCGTAYLOR_00121 [Chromatiales bacterium USCg_Taylor]
MRFLHEATQTIVAAIDRAEHEIALLREYRTRLIADVVAGKLDVREAAARLAEEKEEPEPFDEIEDATDAEEDAGDDIGAVPQEADA